MVFSSAEGEGVDKSGQRGRRCGRAALWPCLEGTRRGEAVSVPGELGRTVGKGLILDCCEGSVSSHM